MMRIAYEGTTVTITLDEEQTEILQKAKAIALQYQSLVDTLAKGKSYVQVVDSNSIRIHSMGTFEQLHKRGEV